MLTTLASLMVVTYCPYLMPYIVRCGHILFGTRWHYSFWNGLAVKFNNGRVVLPRYFINDDDFTLHESFLSKKNFVPIWKVLRFKQSISYALSLATGKNLLFLQQLNTRVSEIHLWHLVEAIRKLYYIKFRKFDGQWCCFYAKKYRAGKFRVYPEKLVMFIIDDSLLAIISYITHTYLFTKGINFYESTGRCGVKGLRFALQCLQRLEHKCQRDKEPSLISVAGTNDKRSRAYGYIKRLGYTQNPISLEYTKVIGTSQYD